MVDRKNRRQCRLVIFVLVISLTFFYFHQRPDKKFHLVFCDVGQGDAILVHYKNKQVLIDGGLPKNYGRLLSCLSSEIPFWDRTIEVVVNTHPDEDHFGGLIEVIKRYRVNKFLHNGYDNPESEKFGEFKRLLVDKKVCSENITGVDMFSIDKLTFERIFPFVDGNQPSDDIQKNFFDKKKKCLVPEFKKQTDNLNNSSIVLQLSFGGFDTLLTGDIEAEIEKILVWRSEIEPVEILKIAHHGSKSSTTQEILDGTVPQMAVISVGENTFGHPAAEVLDRLSARNIAYRRTDINGTVEIVSDGSKWWLTQKKKASLKRLPFLQLNTL